MKSLVLKFSNVFHRQTLSTRYIPELDGLRCVAVLMVLFFHLNGYLMEKNGWAAELPWLTPILGNGFFGVEVFFVISGYIILLPFVPKPSSVYKRPDLLVFYVRRMVRIWPPYALAMTLFLISLAIKNGGIGQFLMNYFASLGFVHNLAFGMPSRIVVVAWTLEVEVQFYLLAPVLASLFLIKRAWVRRSVVVLAIVVSSFLASFSQEGYNVLHFLQYFLCGLLLADLSGEVGATRRYLLLDLVAIGLVPLLFWTVARYGPMAIRVPVLLMVTMTAACRGAMLSWCLSHPWVRFVGGMCFSVYLLHYPLISFFGPLVKKIDLHALPLIYSYVFQGTLLTVVVLMFSTVYFVFVETPFMKRETTDRVVAFLQGSGLFRATSNNEPLRAAD